MKPSIFVAHIDDGFRVELRDELVSRGCDVIEAADGAAALEQFAMAADGLCPWPDVLVLSALGLLIELKDFPDRPPTLLVVGHGGPPIEGTATRLGANRVFQQPVELLDVVDSILGAVCEPRAQRLSSGSATTELAES